MSFENQDSMRKYNFNRQGVWCRRCVWDFWVTLGLCQFNAASLPDKHVTGSTCNKMHCVEWNSHNAFTYFKRWIGSSYQCCDLHTRSSECCAIFWFASVFALLIMSSIFCSQNRRYLNLETWKRLEIYLCIRDKRTLPFCLSMFIFSILRLLLQL